jgi:hypothetical protein
MLVIDNIDSLIVIINYRYKYIIDTDIGCRL